MVTYIFGVHQALVAVDRTRVPSAVFFAKVLVPQQRIVFFFTVLRITYHSVCIRNYLRYLGFHRTQNTENEKMLKKKDNIYYILYIITVYYNIYY